MGVFRRRAAAKDVMTALVEAGTAADLVALYEANPVLATPAALRQLTELIHSARDRGSPGLALAYWWRREFVYQAHHVGVPEAARELLSRVEWYSRAAGVVLLATESTAVEHLVQVTSRAAVKQRVPFLDDRGRAMPDDQRWRTAGTLAWQMEVLTSGSSSGASARRMVLMTRAP
ncbi:hypothetical protein [Actinokineospora cianjurensis]|uniref:Uncharacterized protein n=1 Tax=Actinokineospora cianjurensis TaxID=585224 RepID=A0A421B301_9PSEU|nr:hypothetical protein [Actinokineospora cianjurensis]RLK58771.1 hypothetical protein CLV68_3246 [Actinokineospora cianjurensis]